MKNILLATTALVAFTGAASAEIALTGVAEMGILGGDVYNDVTQFHTDIDVTFTMSGEADNGLTFGANIDLDESDELAIGALGSFAFDPTRQGGEEIFIAYGAARLSMGDVDGAFDAAMAETLIGGALADDNEHIGQAGTDTGLAADGGFGMDDSFYDQQNALFSYSTAGFTGYLSVEVSDIDIDTDGDGDLDEVSPVWGVGVTYTADLAGLALNVGLGYEFGDNDVADSRTNVLGAFAVNDDMRSVYRRMVGNTQRESVWGLSVGTTFSNGIMATVNYAAAQYGEESTALDATGMTGNVESNTSLALGYTMNALTVGVNYGVRENFRGLEDVRATGWGLTANYDLGGGLVAQMGYGKSEIDSDNAELNATPGANDKFDNDQWSLGLAMSF